MTEALTLMAEDFINAIKTGEKPKSDSDMGLNVVEVLDAAEISIKNNGEEIALN